MSVCRCRCHWLCTCVRCVGSNVGSAQLNEAHEESTKRATKLLHVERIDGSGLSVRVQEREIEKERESAAVAGATVHR